MTPELTAALGKLLASGASGSALPLAAKWDTAGALKPQIAQIADRMVASLNDASASTEARIAAAQSLLGLRSANPTALTTVTNVLGSNAAPALQNAIINALGETNDPAIGGAIAAAYNKLPADAQAVAFDILLKRADWTLAFLDAVKDKQVDVTTLGPASAFRLRTHPDKPVAERAGAMLDELNPTGKAKNEAIAKLTPIVEQPGNVANGKALFMATCATCHKFGDLGAEIGPGLTGMGAHGPAELLTAIIDPNREVDPSFMTWNIETKDGQFFSGIIARENPASVILRSLAGEQEVKTANLKTRVNTGRSLMPEGFEALGGEMLRDMLAYMQSESGGHFRTIDLSRGFTANTARGLYITESNPRDTLKFAKTGTVTVEGVPFVIVAPERAPANVVVLKGGPETSFAKTLPQRVDVPVGGFKANRLHFLGGVAGWGHPFNDENEVVMRVTAHTTDGQRIGFNLRNGVEFADYIREVEVPGSKLTKGLVKANQLRWFTLNLERPMSIDRLTLESTNSNVAPTTVAITAELADAKVPGRAGASPAVAGVSPATSNVVNAGSGKNTPPTLEGSRETRSPGSPIPQPPLVPSSTSAGGTPALPGNAATSELKIAPEFSAPVPQPPAQANGPRVLLVGGGSAHDFPKWFGDADKATLAPHVGWVDFTMNANAIAPVLGNVDLLVWSANQPISSETKKALMDWVNAGKPLILLHPGLWYNSPNFPEWNAQVAGGGSRGHDKFGEFEVNVTNRQHPLTAGLPEKFRITDELYYFQPDAKGTPLEVLATATSTQKPGTYPQIFIVKHPTAKIVGITLGHDAKAHGLPEYQMLLKNAVKWATAK